MPWAGRLQMNKIRSRKEQEQDKGSGTHNKSCTNTDPPEHAKEIVT